MRKVTIVLPYLLSAAMKPRSRERKRVSTMVSPRVGQVVEFVTNHPAAKGTTVRGKVVDVGSVRYPCNPTVDTPVGSIELLRSWWGNKVTVVEA